MNNRIMFVPFISLFMGIFFTLPASASLIGDHVYGELHINRNSDEYTVNQFDPPDAYVVEDGYEFSYEGEYYGIYVDIGAESIWIEISGALHIDIREEQSLTTLDQACLTDYCGVHIDPWAIWLTDLHWGDTPGYINDLIYDELPPYLRYEVYDHSVHFYFNPEGDFYLPSDGLSYHFGLDVTHVPIPAALPLFLSSLAGLGLLGRRRRKLEKINNLATA